MGKARALLIDAGIPVYYWEWAVHHPCFITNKLYNLRTKEAPLISLLAGLKQPHDPQVSFKDRLFLSQPGYVANILERFGLSTANPVATPMDNTELRKYDREVDEQRQKTYGEMVGTLMWCATHYHPLILFTASRLARYSVNLLPEHLAAIKRVFHYLGGVKDQGIHLYPSLDGTLSLQLHTDAAFTDDPDTC